MLIPWWRDSLAIDSSELSNITSGGNTCRS
jgi:hypothetical protein